MRTLSFTTKLNLPIRIIDGRNEHLAFVTKRVGNQIVMTIGRESLTLQKGCRYAMRIDNQPVIISYSENKGVNGVRLTFEASLRWVKIYGSHYNVR